MKIHKQLSTIFIVIALFIFVSCSTPPIDYEIAHTSEPSITTDADIPVQHTYVLSDDITFTVTQPNVIAQQTEPNPARIVNDNKPFFNKTNYSNQPFEQYAELDELNRCGTAFANICADIMPSENEERGPIGRIKPSGWQTVTYPGIISDRYLYNRCHLIGWQLAGENDNEKNLITGTRFLNIEGMLPYENSIADYVHQNPTHHVLYRVTPVFNGSNLVADGVLLEAASVETNVIQFCVFLYNMQPGITIDYATGDSQPIIDPIPSPNDTDTQVFDFVLNTKSHKAHDPTCRFVADIRPENREDFTGTMQKITDMRYTFCKTCIGDAPSY